MIPNQRENNETERIINAIGLFINKYYARTGDDIIPQTPEQAEDHLRRAEEKRQRKLNKKRGIK